MRVGGASGRNREIYRNPHGCWVLICELRDMDALMDAKVFLPWSRLNLDVCPVCPCSRDGKYIFCCRTHATEMALAPVNDTG